MPLKHGFGVHEWQRDAALRLLDVYEGKVCSIIFPAFGTVDQEANDHAAAEFRRLSSRHDLETADQSVLAERAYDAGTAHFHELDQALQGVVNGAIANLYHFGWETRVREWLRRSPWLSARQRRTVEGGEFSKLVQLFKAFGWDVSGEPWMPCLDELRLVANAVKHTRGKSVADLYALRPQLFYPVALLGEGEIWNEEPDGNNLIPQEGDFRRYVAALRQFWSAVPEAQIAF